MPITKLLRFFTYTLLCIAFCLVPLQASAKAVDGGDDSLSRENDPWIQEIIEKDRAYLRSVDDDTLLRIILNQYRGYDRHAGFIYESDANKATQVNLVYSELKQRTKSGEFFLNKFMEVAFDEHQNYFSRHGAFVGLRHLFNRNRHITPDPTEQFLDFIVDSEQPIEFRLDALDTLEPLVTGSGDKAAITALASLLYRNFDEDATPDTAPSSSSLVYDMEVTANATRLMAKIGGQPALAAFEKFINSIPTTEQPSLFHDRRSGILADVILNLSHQPGETFFLPPDAAATLLVKSYRRFDIKKNGARIETMRLIVRALNSFIQPPFGTLSFSTQITVEDFLTDLATATLRELNGRLRTRQEAHNHGFDFPLPHEEQWIELWIGTSRNASVAAEVVNGLTYTKNGGPLLAAFAAQTVNSELAKQAAEQMTVAGYSRAINR